MAWGMKDSVVRMAAAAPIMSSSVTVASPCSGRDHRAGRQLIPS
jgi:hypothetical protein